MKRIPDIDSWPPKIDTATTGAPLSGCEAAGRGVAGGPTETRDFTIAIERLESGTAVVALAGELDLYRAPEIEQALAQAISQSGDEGPPRLAVDLRSVTFLDSTTLKILLAASRRQRARGGELLVLVGPQTPTNAFEVTGFDRLLAISRVDDDPRAAAA